MASDDRPADRPRFTLRRFFTPDDEPAESAPAEEPAAGTAVPAEAFGTGDVDDDALDAIVESALVWGSDEVPPPVPGAVVPPGEIPEAAADLAGAEEGVDPFGAEHASADEFFSLPGAPAPPASAEADEELPLAFESAVLEDEPEDLSGLDAVADAIDLEDLGDPFESPAGDLGLSADRQEPDADAASVGLGAGFFPGSPSDHEPAAGGESDGAEGEASFWEVTEPGVPAAEANAAEAPDVDPLGLATDSFGGPDAEAEAAAEAQSADPSTLGMGLDDTETADAEAPDAAEAALVEAEPAVADASEARLVDADGTEGDAELEAALADPDDPVRAEGLPSLGAEPADAEEVEVDVEADASEPDDVEAADTHPVELVSEPVEDVAAPADLVSEPVKPDSEPVDLVSESVGLDAEPVDLVSEPVEPDSESPEIVPEPVGLDAEAVGPDPEAVEADAETALPDAADSEPMEAKPLGAGSDAPDAMEDEASAPETDDPDAPWIEASTLVAVAAVGGLASSDPTPSDPEPIPMETAEIDAELTTAETTAETTAAVDDAFEAQADPAKSDAAPAGGIDGDLEVRPLGPEDFAPGELRAALRTMMLSRKLDEKMLTLLKQGKGFFHIGSAGHEASQIAVARQFQGGHDWFCLYYRDLATALTVGLTPSEVLRAHYGKAADVFGGGRQMPEHFGHRGLNILSTSSSVGAQYVPAVGFALAVQREDGDAEATRAVYASGGEGSTSQGAFHEALNWAAREALPVLFHIQDNKFAISVPVEEQTAGGSIWHLLGGYAGLRRLRYDGTDFFESAAAAKAAMEHIRAGLGPVALHADLVRLLPHSSSDDHKKYRAAESLEADAARDPIPRLAGQLVEAGVMTEAEVDALRTEVAAEIDALAKVIEKEADPDPATATAHVYYEGPDSRVYEQPGEAGELVVMVDAINHALDEEMTRDPKVLVYGEDVGGGKGGVFTATRGLSAKHGRDRCFNSPLAEHSVIGSAVGLACAGYKPVVEIQFADYIWPGMQPLRNQVASMRYRSNNAWACPMVIRVPAGGYIHGGLCHSQNIEALFAHWPGLHVVMPSNAADAKGLLKSAIRGEDPVLFLEHKALYRQGPARRPEPHDEYLVPLGEAAVAREGTDLTIVTWGAIVYKALATAKLLEKEGVSVEVIDVRSIQPFDAETVLASVRKTGRVLVAYEDHEFMGFGAEIAAQIADSAFGSLDAPVKRVAGAFSSVPYADALEKAVLPQDADILRAAREVLAY